MYDTVMDSQQAYRLLVKAYSFPGDCVDLSKQADKFTYELACNKAMQTLIHVLLDADTSFHAFNHNELIQQVEQITYCPHKDIDKSAFIIALNDVELMEALFKANKGNLENPHLGATILYQVDSLLGNQEYIIKGPGINGTKTIYLNNALYWLKARANAIADFPLGVDMIIVDNNNQCMVLPRTSQIVEVL